MLPDDIAGFIFPSVIPTYGRGPIILIRDAYDDTKLEKDGDIIQVCCSIASTLREHGRDIRTFVEETIWEKNLGLTPFDSSQPNLTLLATPDYDRKDGTVTLYDAGYEDWETSRRRGTLENNCYHEFFWYFFQLHSSDQLRVFATYMALSQAEQWVLPCKRGRRGVQVAPVPIRGGSNGSKNSSGDTDTQLHAGKKKRRDMDQRGKETTPVGTVRVSELRQSDGTTESDAGLRGVLLDSTTRDHICSSEGQSSHPYTATKKPRLEHTRIVPSTGGQPGGQVCTPSSATDGTQSGEEKDGGEKDGAVQQDVEEARKARRRELARKRRAEHKARVEKELKEREEKEIEEQLKEKKETISDEERLAKLAKIAEKLVTRIQGNETEKIEKEPPTPEPYNPAADLPPGYAPVSQDAVLSLCK